MDNVVLAAIIGGVGGIATATINKGWFSPKQVEYDGDALIDSHISALGHKYGCQRISIIGFHNGGFWGDGTSIKKFTMRHEYYNMAHTSSIFSNMQNLSTGFLKEIPSLLFRNNIIFEANIEKTMPIVLVKPAYYKILQEYNTVATVIVAIKRKLFNWKKLKYEIVMVGSVHFSWGQFNNQWTKSFVESSKDRIPFANDVNLLLTMFDKNHIKNDTLTMLERAIEENTWE